MAEALDAFLVKLKECSTGNQAFTFIIDDPSGNSFIENPYVEREVTLSFFLRKYG